jgi:hypothetical protein
VSPVVTPYQLRPPGGRSSIPSKDIDQTRAEISHGHADCQAPKTVIRVDPFMPMYLFGAAHTHNVEAHAATRVGAFRRRALGDQC